MGFLVTEYCWLLSFQAVNFFADKSLQYWGGALGNWFRAIDKINNIFLREKCEGDRVWSYLYNKMDSLQWILCIRHDFEYLFFWGGVCMNIRGILEYGDAGCWHFPLILRNDLMFWIWLFESLTLVQRTAINKEYSNCSQSLKYWK